jgi:hypothetical protein
MHSAAVSFVAEPSLGVWFPLKSADGGATCSFTAGSLPPPPQAERNTVAAMQTALDEWFFNGFMAIFTPVAQINGSAQSFALGMTRAR